jgi:hypothetical protein
MEASGHRHPGAPRRSEAPSRRAAAVVCTDSERAGRKSGWRRRLAVPQPTDERTGTGWLRCQGREGYRTGTGVRTPLPGRDRCSGAPCPPPRRGERRSAVARARAGRVCAAANVQLASRPLCCPRGSRPGARGPGGAGAHAAAGMHFALISEAGGRSRVRSRTGGTCDTRAPRTFNARQTCHMRPARFPCACQLSVRCRTGRGFYAFAND